MRTDDERSEDNESRSPSPKQILRTKVKPEEAQRPNVGRGAETEVAHEATDDIEKVSKVDVSHESKEEVMQEARGTIKKAQKVDGSKESKGYVGQRAEKEVNQEAGDEVRKVCKADVSHNFKEEISQEDEEEISQEAKDEIRKDANEQVRRERKKNVEWEDKAKGSIAMVHLPELAGKELESEWWTALRSGISRRCTTICKFLKSVAVVATVFAVAPYVLPGRPPASDVVALAWSKECMPPVRVFAAEMGGVCPQWTTTMRLTASPPPLLSSIRRQPLCALPLAQAKPPPPAAAQAADAKMEAALEYLESSMMMIGTACDEWFGFSPSLSAFLWNVKADARGGRLYEFGSGRGAVDVLVGRIKRLPLGKTEGATAGRAWWCAWKMQDAMRWIELLEEMEDGVQV